MHKTTEAIYREKNNLYGKIEHHGIPNQGNKSNFFKKPFLFFSPKRLWRPSPSEWQ